MAKKKSDSQGAGSLRKQAEQRLQSRGKDIEPVGEQDSASLIHELRVHQVELEMQNEQLLASRRELEESLSRYSDLFDFAPAGYIVFDSEGLIVDINLTGASMLAAERGRLKKKPFHLFVAAESRDIFHSHRAQVLKSGQPADCELKLLRKDKADFWVQVHSAAVLCSEGKVIQCRSSIIDVTARKEAEAKIQQLARFPDEDPSPVMRADAEGMVVYANAPAADLLADMGWKKGQPLPAEFLKPVRQTLMNGRVEEFEYTCPSNWVFSFAASSAGGREDVHIYGRDITAAAADRTALRETQMDLKRAQAVAHVGSWRLDVRKNELLWSDECYRIFGIPEGTPLTYETFLDAVDPYDREYVDREWQGALKGEAYDIQHRIIVEGKTRWVRERAELELDEEGNLESGFGTCQDITETKEAEAALRASRDRWRSFIELTGQFAWTTNADGEVVEDMPEWRRFTGQSFEDIKGWGWSKAIHPDDAEHTREVWRKAVREKRNYETEYRIRGRDGEYRHFLARGVPVFNEDGSVREWVGTCIDITEQKEAREALERSREYLNRAQAIAHVGSWKLDVTKNVLTWSDENYRIFERPSGEPQTYESFLECVHPEDRESVDEKWQAALRGEDYDIEHRTLAGGKEKWVREKAYLEFDDDWKLLGGFGITQDITERKLAEEELRRSNEELNRFNKVAVGREMRIIEMKKEVNELCERLGEERRYPLKFIEEAENKENEDGKKEA